jgi:hypothetical protein
MKPLQTEVGIEGVELEYAGRLSSASAVFAVKNTHKKEEETFLKAALKL